MIARFGLRTNVPSGPRQVMPSTCASGVPFAISTMVKSYSSRATKSIAGLAARLESGSIATLAPTKPTMMAGLRCLMSAAVRMSWLKLGVEVWRITRSRSSNSCAMSSHD